MPVPYHAVGVEKAEPLSAQECHGHDVLFVEKAEPLSAQESGGVRDWPVPFPPILQRVLLYLVHDVSLVVLPFLPLFRRRGVPLPVPITTSR